MLATVEINLLEEECLRIMAFASGLSNDETYACMLSSWQSGEGVLPLDFGLAKDELNQLLMTHFPGLAETMSDVSVQDYDRQRDDEREDVLQLLLSYRTAQPVAEFESATWMANIVAMACQGQDHLWQDLGLWSRDQLSQLMEHNFPALAAKNVKNMKWKKFIYKQLCITEGIYTCRAPSCEVCADYADCFSGD